ncbi:FAD-dependent oxidoreductase, partial [Klebsiella aerogenes]|uniref:FAD-dependent oxidoreductase n=1 Tax=Klebsiella aerogenes TaxID=548 RepID=UPI0021D250BC
MMRRLVIIGNGMAATRLAEKLAARAQGRFIITLIGDEPQPAYNRIQLSPVLGGEKTAAQIQLLPAGWDAQPGVRVRLGGAGRAEGAAGGGAGGG